MDLKRLKQFWLLIPIAIFMLFTIAESAYNYHPEYSTNPRTGKPDMVTKSFRNISGKLPASRVYGNISGFGTFTTVSAKRLILNGTTPLTCYKEGPWPVTPTNLTVVGTPTYTGTYTRIGNRVTGEITVSSTISTEATVNSTFFNLYYKPSGFAAISFYTTGAAITGGGYTDTSSAILWPPSWGPATTVVISFSYATTAACP